ncbi:hypothetical protein wVul_0969 [Wolbachia endosymbiont of Armadillidium vulgare str. wVulC]|nr:hypothetical protein wVul_0969 [Wolbachia endosymbiont of Armadillidium vulgare str. wVulC]
MEKIVEKVRPEREKVEKQKKYHGRTSNLPKLEGKIFCIIFVLDTT